MNPAEPSEAHAWTGSPTCIKRCERRARARAVAGYPKNAFSIMPTTHERLAALVLAEKQRKQSQVEAAQQAREAVISKRRNEQQARAATAAAAAAAAVHAALKASTYRMPADSSTSSGSSSDGSHSSERRTPHKVQRRRPAPATERGAASEAPLPAMATGSVEQPVVVPESALFVHFIPPPLRSRDKPDLAWIVHTCNGSGCREARHVNFMSVTGFSTYEGQPPEVAEGLACGCQIANHHLRGYGTVRFEGDVAIIEDESEVSSIDAHAYLAKAKAEAKANAQCREQIKALKEREQALKKQVEALRVELAGCGVSLSQLEAARLAKEQEQQAQEEEREVVHAINGWLKGESRREPWQEMSA